MREDERCILPGKRRDTALTVIQSPIASVPLSATLAQQARDVLYYQPAWLNLISQVYGYSVSTLTSTNTNGEINGILPVCTVSSPITGKRIVALPFSDHCPLLAHALYVRWLLPLSPDPDTIWSSLRKPIQRQIKKSESLGVKVRLARQRDEITSFYRLHVRTRSQKHGMPAQPSRFFLDLWDTFAAQGALQLLLAEHQGSVIAGMILLAAGATVRYAYGASHEAYLPLAPNNLLMWTAITWGCQHGYQTLDLGRTACDNAGLMEFKRRWGATQEPLPYYYSPRVDGLASTSERSWKFRLLTDCWRRMPLQVAGPLGGHLYKHLG
jgi:CelD/BcsL family acetyltransferase involved in cellulose biosynthesis